MLHRTLGRTGLKISEISMGGLFVASFAADLDTARLAVRKALDLGINYIDTAPGYGNSEEVLGKCLQGAPKDLIISTKLGGRPQPFDPRDKKALHASLDQSLRLLGREHIDILLIHEPDRPGQYDWWPDPDVIEGPVLEVLDEAKRAGKIRHTGVGGTTTSHLAYIAETGKFDVVLTAFNYSLLYREAEIELLPACYRRNLGIVVGSPLQQGLFARRQDEAVRKGARWLSKPRREQLLALYALCDETGIPLPEMGMRWVIGNPQISCTLTGSRSPQEVEANVAAVAKGPLPAEVRARLDRIAATVPFRPYEEPFSLPLGGKYKGPGIAR